MLVPYRTRNQQGFLIITTMYIRIVLYCTARKLFPIICVVISVMLHRKCIVFFTKIYCQVDFRKRKTHYHVYPNVYTRAHGSQSLKSKLYLIL